MITTLRHQWQETRSSVWFVTAVIVLAAVRLATGLIAPYANIEVHFGKKWPLFFGAGAAGSRGLVTAVARSMIMQEGTITTPFGMTEHNWCTDKNGQDLPDIRNREWRLHHA